MNRGLRQIKVSTANLQLLGVVCLFLAAKKEECLFPEVQPESFTLPPLIVPVRRSVFPIDMVLQSFVFE